MLTMPTALRQQGEELRTKRDQLAKYLEKKDADGRVIANEVERTAIKTLDAEINQKTPIFLQAKEDWLMEEGNKAALKGLVDPEIPLRFFPGARGHDGAGHDMDGNVKSFGQQWVESAGYQAFLESKKKNRAVKSNGLSVELEDASLKTLFQRSAGWQPFVNRQPGFIASAQQQPKIIDLMPTLQTSEMGIKWMLETVYQNNAAAVAEGNLYPESAFQLAEQFSPVQKIGHYIPVTDEQVADVPASRDYLDNRMRLGLGQALDRQILSGNGVTPNLSGLLGGTVAGMLAQAQGKDYAHDAVYKAMVAIQMTAFTTASAIWLNPLDWQNIRLFKTVQGLYLFGNPDQAGGDRMWGLPVGTSTYIPVGTGIVGDFQTFSCLWYRQGIGVEVSNSHNDFFQRGQLAMRAEVRAAVTYTRPSAFNLVGFNPGGVPSS